MRPGSAYCCAVPTYRLLTGHGDVLQSFDAADDVAAEGFGRTASGRFPQAAADGDFRADFRVERQDGDAWHFVTAWVPTPPDA